MPAMRCFLLALAGILVFAAASLAELPSIRFDRLSPLGLAAGGSVEAEVVGADLEGLRSLRFDHPGLTAEPIDGKDRWFTITAAADVPAGTYDVRLLGRFGVSSSKLLAVQRGLTEVLEVEPNNDQAQQVQVNNVVNGASDSENIDHFRFTARAGQRIVLDVDAQQLDSMLDAQLLLLNGAGKQLASSSDYHGRDPLIDIVIPADGDYIAVIHDLSYRGGYSYRLTVSDRPHVENVFPRAIQRGKTAELFAFGRNMGIGATAGAATGEPALESMKTTISANVQPGLYTFLNHPTDHSVLPTGATFRFDGIQARPTFATGESLTPVTMLVCDAPVVLESEPNVKDSPQAIALPAVVSGRFDQRSDADWFEFTATENGQVAIEVYAERIAAPADPYFVLLDEQGNRVQEFDDYGHRINAFDAHLRDAVGSVNVQKDKKYRVLVQDRYQRGGPRFQYVLTINKPEPQVYAGVIHRENPTPAGLNLWSGGATWLDVVLHREGGSTPVTLTAEGLPPGLHCLPTTIPTDTRGVFVLWSDEGTVDWTGGLKLFATYKRGDQQIKQEVRPYTRVWNDAKGTSRPVRELAASVREKAPFSVAPEKDRIDAKPGDKIELKLQLKRLWPEFSGEVKLSPLSFPGEFQMPDTAIMASASEATVTIKVQDGAPTGEFTLALQAQAQVPFNKDPAAKEKPNTLVSVPSRPFTISVKQLPKQGQELRGCLHSGINLEMAVCDRANRSMPSTWSSESVRKAQLEWR